MIFNYVLSDESINSKGFIILTSGIELERFHANPVALFNHNIDKVVGHWENVKINEQNSEELVGTIVFDYSDPESQAIMNKVTKNLIKHVSIGIQILEFYEDIIDGQDMVVVTKSNLKEASVTPLPANENAIKLTYNGEEVFDNTAFLTNKQLNKEQVMNSELLNLTNEVNDLKNQIKDNDSVLVESNSAKESLKTELELKDKEIAELKASVDSLTQKFEDIAKVEADQKFSALLDDAIEDSKIKESQKEDFLKLTYDNAKLIIDGLDSKNIKPEVKLTDEIKNDSKEDVEEHDIRWYEKNDVDALKLMYNEDKAKYDKLYNEFYN